MPPQRSNRVELDTVKAHLLADDLERVLNVIPELEKLARVQVRRLSPPAEGAMLRLRKLKSQIRGEKE